MAEKTAWHYLVLFCREDDDESPEPLAAFWDMNEAEAFAERYRKQIGLVHVHEFRNGSWESAASCDVDLFISQGADYTTWIKDEADGGETAG